MRALSLLLLVACQVESADAPDALAADALPPGAFPMAMSEVVDLSGGG